MSCKPLCGILFGASVLGTTLMVSGCNRQPSQAANTTTDATSGPAGAAPELAAATVVDEEEHGHKPGAHGGIIVPIGRDSYHAEAVFEQGGTLRLFMLGQDEGRVQEVDSQTLTAYVKAVGGTDSVSISMEPERLEDDAEGKTSQFVAKLPEELAGQPVEVTVPSLRINGERFRLGFSSESAHEEAGDHGGSDMPEKVADGEEQALYLTPGGHYTAADIEANGRVTASQKFKGVRAAHDMNPKPGDKICPITMTKANAKFSWVVGGKTYEFCCPPCVDEFVSTAKSGGEVGDPEDYVQR